MILVRDFQGSWEQVGAQDQRYFSWLFSQFWLTGSDLSIHVEIKSNSSVSLKALRLAVTAKGDEAILQPLCLNTHLEQKITWIRLKFPLQGSLWEVSKSGPTLGGNQNWVAPTAAGHQVADRRPRWEISSSNHSSQVWKRRGERGAPAERQLSPGFPHTFLWNVSADNCSLCLAPTCFYSSLWGSSQSQCTTLLLCLTVVLYIISWMPKCSPNVFHKTLILWFWHSEAAIMAALRSRRTHL